LNDFSESHPYYLSFRTNDGIEATTEKFMGLIEETHLSTVVKEPSQSGDRFS